MKRILTVIAILIAAYGKSQMLVASNGSSPFLSETSAFWQITLDATYGNRALVGYTPVSDVYLHMGAITTKSTGAGDWRYVKTVWGTSGAAGLNAPSTGTNKWAITTVGSTLRTYFGITDTSEHILKIAILFRNGAGTTVQRNIDGSDMYIPLYDNNLHARIDLPASQPTYSPLPEPISKAVGDTLPITANANSSCNMTLYFNGAVVNTITAAKQIKKTVTIATPGNQQIVVSATNGSTTSNDTVNFVVVAANTILPLPSGVTDGINYEPGDTSVTMVLYAPLKKNCFIIGDFTNNYKQLSKYQMNRTPDSSRYWIRVTGLTPGVEYGYQYVIDGALKVADYNCEKILDPSNDRYISKNTYPNLKPYPTAYTTGIVSVLQTAKPKYTWAVPNFTRPDKRNLVIYELLVRDFLDSQNWQTLKDTISYLKTLGINTIELMPFNEFDGNNSWGYNPSFYFAPDKAYGTELALKAFIDECHKNGIAIIQDIVMNHSWGSSPMVQMYFNSAGNTPAANSPWFNVSPTHDYNVGYQFNHQSQATKDFVDRVVNHWLTNYHVDGFRWDLSKGFTQNVTVGNVAAWGNYDQNRVDTWKRIYDKIQNISSGAYCILEHFADNSEETVLANYGMMPWGNLNYSYSQAAMGYTSGWDLSWGVAAARGWNQPYLVTYAESHDEERMMYRNETSGNVNGGYNIKNVATSLQRSAAAATIWSMIPGPKMMWQFGELGYDTSIHRCSNGTVVAGSCNTDPKPVMWNYAKDPGRKALYNVYSKLLKLRTSPQYQSTFTTGVIAGNYNLGGSVKQLKVYDANMSVVAFANFDVSQVISAISFPTNGTWYYYVGSTNNYTSISVSGYTYNFTLQPGEYYVFTSVNAKQVLPATFLAFTAKKVDNSTVAINWNIGTEINCLSYDVERSYDGEHFTAIGTVEAKGGTIAKDLNYSFMDNSPYLAGYNYYRIKVLDKDGAVTYSNIQKVSMEAKIKTITVRPNPAHSETTVQINDVIGKKVISLNDLSGKTVFKTIVYQTAAEQAFRLSLNNLPKGMYFLKVITDTETLTDKLLLY